MIITVIIPKIMINTLVILIHFPVHAITKSIMFTPNIRGENAGTRLVFFWNFYVQHFLKFTHKKNLVHVISVGGNDESEQSEQESISATWSTLYPEVDVLQQEKSTSTHYCEEQESEAAMGTSSPKLDSL